MITLSLRRLWTIYRRIAIAQGTGAGKRDPQLSQVAFYAGARGVLKVLDHMIAEGDDDAVHQTIKRYGRQIRAIQGLHPRARRATDGDGGGVDGADQQDEVHHGLGGGARERRRRLRNPAGL